MQFDLLLPLSNSSIFHFP